MTRLVQLPSPGSTTVASPLLSVVDLQGLADKLKESEEAQKVLQKDCETYKKVLAETVRGGWGRFCVLSGRGVLCEWKGCFV